MTITTLQVSNYDNPTEVQVWLDAHPSATIVQFTALDNVFYIIWK